LTSELFSHQRYKGYYLFVECVEDETLHIKYEGVAQLNGTSIYHSLSHISGDSAENKLKEKINESTID
jgi:hypothetical protein